MTIKSEFITLQGAPLEGENPLPKFRACNHDTSPKSNGTLTPEQLVNFGTETAFRVLPYKMQDRYNRKKKTMEFAAIILENDCLRAEFLPDFGGRLYALKDKKSGKDLLYRNPVMQPANLAIRNAWFSGGIEWNIAQLGHTYSTCDKVFFASVQTDEGYTFLRMYDYERTRGLLWQIDFHLPEGSTQLYAHTTIMNDTSDTVPMYWWTNIAVREEPGCRVFSGTKEVLYVEPKSLLDEGAHSFGKGELPSLPVLPEKDASYPEYFHYTSEYFFQNPETMESPWEAITYPDGSVFFERSTQPLSIRKMFCWGSHNGGKRWRDFLSVPGKGDYIEIQAGLAPTQLHTIFMDAHSAISFTQCFGNLALEAGDSNHPDYSAAQLLVKSAVNASLPAQKVLEMDDTCQRYASLPCTKLMHSGQGWGALEQARRLSEGLPLLPRQFNFPPETLTDQQQDWLALLSGQLPGTLEGSQIPASFLTDPLWLPYLDRCLSSDPCNVTGLLLKGILLYENGNREDACNCWRLALEQQNLPILWRNLAYAARENGEIEAALNLMENACLERYPNIDHAYYEEYFRLLLQAGFGEKVYGIYRNLPLNLRQKEALLLEACEAAEQVLTDDSSTVSDEEVTAFLEQAFTKEYALIREGETRMSDIWFSYAKKKGIPAQQIPEHLDMRLTIS